MKKRPLLLFSILSLFVLPSVWAQGSADDRAERRGQAFLECFEREYNPSAEQMEKIRALHADREQMREMRTKIRDARQKLHEAMRSDASEAELRKQFSEVQKLKQEMKSNYFERMLSLRAILTPEQREKLGACRMKMHHSKGQRHQNWK